MLFKPRGFEKRGSETLDGGKGMKRRKERKEGKRRKEERREGRKRRSAPWQHYGGSGLGGKAVATDWGSAPVANLLTPWIPHAVRAWLGVQL
jgi:hypothetical protein